MKIAIYCEFCGEKFFSKRANPKYCSRSCCIKMNHKMGSYEYKSRGFKKGHVPQNKGVSNPELSKRQRKNNVAKRTEVKEKIRQAQLKHYREKGNHPWNYIDGSSRNRKYRLSEWLIKIKEIYKRDNYTCQNCGKRGGLLNCHHILPWSGSPELAFEDDNLITLCVPCHSRIHKIQQLGSPCKTQEVRNENSTLI